MGPSGEGTCRILTDARETGFYDRNADKFIRDTLTVDMTAVLHRFIEHLPEGAAILDAGCGADRDAKNFLNMGYSVTAFDAAGSMVRHAADYTGLPVTQLTFQ